MKEIYNIIIEKLERDKIGFERDIKDEIDYVEYDSLAKIRYERARAKKDYASDLINERTYKELLLRNKQEQDLLEQKLQSLRNIQESITYKLMRLDQLKHEFNRFLDNVELSSDMVNSLIERIELSYYTKTEDGKKHRQIIIKYKFIDDSI